MSKKYHSPEDIWDTNENKLCVHVLEAAGLASSGADGSDSKCEARCIVRLGKKKIGKTAVAKGSTEPQWNEMFLASGLDDEEYLTVDVYTYKKGTKQFAGSATLFQLQTLQPYDEVIDHWYELKNKRGHKDKDTIKAGSKVHLRLYYSVVPESSRLLQERPSNSFFYSYYKNLFKTGDLILYDGMGALATVAKVESNAPFSQVGMILRLPSRWTHEDTIYVIETTRNIDKLADAFTENPDSGIAVFRLFDRLHQFHGPSLWWASLKAPISEQGATAGLKWLKSMSDKYKNYVPPKNEEEKGSPSSVSFDCLRYDLNAAMRHIDVIGLHKPTFAQFAELASLDLVAKALFKMGVLKDESAISKMRSAVDLVQQDFFLQPVALRVGPAYDQLEMLPPPLRPIHISRMKKQGIFLRQSEPAPSAAPAETINADVSKSPIRKGTNLARAGSASIPGTTSASEKLALVRRATMLFDMSDDNLLKIMKKGCRPMRLTSAKIVEKRMMLSEDESELICGNKHIEVTDIVEVRTGQKTTIFDHHRKDVTSLDQLSFSVMYGRRGKYGQHANSIDLIVKTELEYKVWLAGLNMLIQRVSNIEEAFIWKKYRDMKRPKLNLHSTMKLLAQLNFKAPTKYVQEKFAIVDSDRNHYLDYSEFIVLLRLLRERPKIGDLFAQYTNGALLMTPEQMQKFLKQEQEQDAPVDFCTKLILKFAKEQTNPPALTRGEFELYMTSGLNQLMDLRQYDTTQDMQRPLSHYFVASSHNTYLEGHQLAGSSSTEQYIQVLKQGCRCVEMDCWDGDNGEPIIYHGHTLTSKIKFEHACIAIKNFAFYSSSYPVILSIENHCSVPQQTRMAQIMRSVFGDMLFESKDRANTDTSGFLPSPELLKEKILVKGAMSARVDQLAPKYDAQGNLVAPDDPASDDEDDAKKNKKEEKVSQELSEVIFLKTVGFKGFEKTKTQQPWEMSSFVETKTASLAKSEGVEFRKYNVKCLARVYPKGFRFDSSNYDVYPAWSAGCQLVAINYQTPGDPLYYNEAMFARQGGCGFILKPIHMIDSTKLTPNLINRITVNVIDARSLPKKKDDTKRPVIDPRVQLKIAGSPSDTKEWQTRVIKDNGFAPVWEEGTTFEISESWSACLIIRVCDAENDNYVVAHYSIMVEDLRSGYRVVPLYEENMKIIPMANLLLHVKVDRNTSH